MKWRPENWSYGDGYSKPQRKCLHGKGRVRAFEAGADAMLEALRKEGYETSQGDGLRLLFGTDVFIPDDPQPSEKPAEKSVMGDLLDEAGCIGYGDNHGNFIIKPKPQLMICPKAKECGDKCEFPPHTIPHKKDNTGCLANAGISHCPACVPYVPEKETISGWWLNHITGNKEFATINIPPFIKVKIEDNQGYHLQHPASKVIESGYLEIVFGKGLVEVPKLSCTFTRN